MLCFCSHVPLTNYDDNKKIQQTGAKSTNHNPHTRPFEPVQASLFPERSTLEDDQQQQNAKLFIEQILRIIERQCKKLMALTQCLN